MIDSHCHLYFPEFDQDRDEVIKRARETGVSFLVQIGASLEGSRKAVELANQYDDMAASVGMHPCLAGRQAHEAMRYADERKIPPLNLPLSKGEYEGVIAARLTQDLEKLKKLALENKKVKAIGECGLDFGKTGEIGDDEKEAQIALFEAQIALAQELKLPLIIHCCNAHKEIVQMLQASSFKFHGVVIHCFTGAWEDAKRYLDLGCYISFSGIVSFKKAEAIQEAAAKMPLDRILVETDAPYLAPEPHRGKRNEPAFVRNIIQLIADLRGASFDEIEKATNQNAGKIFK